LRATHTAAAHTSWDMTSPPFIRDDCLFIPSGFVTWGGHALDLKTPLLRVNQKLSEEGVRLLRNLGDKESKKVVSNVGWEQGLKNLFF
jgi:glutamine synthetase